MDPGNDAWRCLRFFRVQSTLDPPIRTGDIALVFRGCIVQIGAFATEQIQIGHGVVVDGIQFERLLHFAQAFLDSLPHTRPQICTDRRVGFCRACISSG